MSGIFKRMLAQIDLFFFASSNKIVVSFRSLIRWFYFPKRNSCRISTVKIYRNFKALLNLVVAMNYATMNYATMNRSYFCEGGIKLRQNPKHIISKLAVS